MLILWLNSVSMVGVPLFTFCLVFVGELALKQAFETEPVGECGKCDMGAETLGLP